MNCKKTGEEGMTTVELLSGLIIALILLGAASTVFFAVLGSFTRYADLSENQMAVESVCNMITDQIAFAEFAAVGDEPEEGCSVIQFSEEGRILLNGEDLYSDSFYNDKRFVCTIPEPESGMPGQVFRVNVNMEDKNGRSLYSSDIVVELVNMGINGGKIRYIMNEDRKRGVDSGGQAVYISFREVQP